MSYCIHVILRGLQAGSVSKSLCSALFVGEVSTLSRMSRLSNEMKTASHGIDSWWRISFKIKTLQSMFLVCFQGQYKEGCVFLARRNPKPKSSISPWASDLRMEGLANTFILLNRVRAVSSCCASSTQIALSCTLQLWGLVYFFVFVGI